MAEEIKEQAPVAEEEKAPATEEKRAPRGDKAPRKDFKKGGKGKDDRHEKKSDGLDERVVFINRVSKTVKGGRRMKFTALVVVGDHKGKYGFALAKSAEVPDAITKARDAAKRKLYTVKLVGTGKTISHEIVGKFGACNVFLKPAPEGTGIIAGGPVRAILELAGVENVCSKVYGSRAPINIIRATNQGLDNLKNYKDVRAMRSNGSEEAK